ncbi:tripartite tricarboxylate transporter substrate binding protein [Candidatus Parcubacteria bacterium]|nr:tripartite tricarboxylate transporter substrate binding protein [Candidatus Parcubacteria bacterium]
MKRVLALLFTLFGGVAHAQYPERPIKIVVPFVAGTSIDSVARIVAQGMGDSLSTNVIVENRGSSSGIPGALAVSMAAPDGYTLMMASTPIMITNELILDTPYSAAQFEPVGLVGTFNFVVAATTKLIMGKTLANIAELRTFAEAHPGALNVGVSGTANTTTLCAHALLHQMEIKAQLVPYRGNAEFVLDLIEGKVHLACVPEGLFAPLLKEGRLTGLALIGQQRSPFLPQVPTVGEVDIMGFESVAKNWHGLFAPKGVSAEIKMMLNKHLCQFLQSPSAVTALYSASVVAQCSTPSELASIIKDQGVRWKELLRSAGINRR